MEAAPFPIIDMSADGAVLADGTMSGISGLVVHHTGPGVKTPEQLIRILSERGYGVTYAMDRDGQVYRLVPEGTRTQHVGIGNRKSSDFDAFSNSNLEGIEIMAADDGDLTPAQVAAFPKFAASLVQKYGYSPDMVLGHGMISSNKQLTEGATAVYSFRAAYGLPLPKDAKVGSEGRERAFSYAGITPEMNPFVAAAQAARSGGGKQNSSAWWQFALARANAPPTPRPDPRGRPTGAPPQDTKRDRLRPSVTAPQPATLSQRLADLRTQVTVQQTRAVVVQQMRDAGLDLALDPVAPITPGSTGNGTFIYRGADGNGRAELVAFEAQDNAIGDTGLGALLGRNFPITLKDGTTAQDVSASVLGNGPPAPASGPPQATKGNRLTPAAPGKQARYGSTSGISEAVLGKPPAIPAAPVPPTPASDPYVYPRNVLPLDMLGDNPRLVPYGPEGKARPVAPDKATPVTPKTIVSREASITLHPDTKFPVIVGREIDQPEGSIVVGKDESRLTPGDARPPMPGWSPWVKMPAPKPAPAQPIRTPVTMPFGDLENFRMGSAAPAAPKAPPAAPAPTIALPSKPEDTYWTSPNGNTYRVGDVFTVGKGIEGDPFVDYAVTANGIQRMLAYPTHPTIVGGAINRGLKAAEDSLNGVKPGKVTTQTVQTQTPAPRPRPSSAPVPAAPKPAPRTTIRTVAPAAQTYTVAPSGSRSFDGQHFYSGVTPGAYYDPNAGWQIAGIRSPDNRSTGSSIAD